MVNKKAYFQGGGGVNEPTPGKKKYKVDPFIVVQPRFKEPFYRNYDLYDTEGVSGTAQHGPGSGWSHMDEHKSVQEFLEFRRKRLQGKYVADDSYIEDTPSNYKERVDKMKTRANLLNRLVKLAEKNCTDADIEYDEGRDAYRCKNCGHKGFNGPYEPKPTVEELHSGKDYTQDDNDGPNFDYGDGAYTAMSEGKKMKSITDAPHKSPGAFFADDNDLGTGFYENLEHYKSVRDFIEHTPLGRDHGAKIKPEWERAKEAQDLNLIDFPVDEDINHDSIIYPTEGEYQIRRMKGDKYVFPSDGESLGYENLNISLTSPQIAGEHSYLPDADFDGRPDNGSSLNFGRDYDDESAPMGRSWDEGQVDDLSGGCPDCGWLGDPPGTVGPNGYNMVYDTTYPCGNCGRGGPILDNSFDIDALLDQMEAKYLDENDSDMLEPAETEIYGLPDGVEPQAKDADRTIQNMNPWDTKSDIGTQIYEDKWNI